MYEIYSKVDCSNCDIAKRLLVEENLEHVTKILDVHFTREDIYKVAPLSHRTFPVIIKDGVYLGGLRQLREDIEEGSGV